MLLPAWGSRPTRIHILIENEQDSLKPKVDQDPPWRTAKGLTRCSPEIDTVAPEALYSICVAAVVGQGCLRIDACACTQPASLLCDESQIYSQAQCLVHECSPD